LRNQILIIQQEEEKPMGVVWGLMAAFAFGTADYAAARSSRKIGVYSTLMCMQIVGFVLLSVMLLATGEWRAVSSARGVAAASLWMFVDLLGILALYRGLHVGQASVVAPIASSFSVVTVILALLSGETVGGIALAGIGLTAVGVVCATIAPSSPGSRTDSPSRLAAGALWAILASLLLGSAFFGLRTPVEDIGGWATAWIGRLQASILLPASLWLAKRKPAWPKERRGWLLVLAVGTLDALALTSYNTGLTLERTAIVITAASLFAVVTLLWGVGLGKERLGWNQWVGVLLTFAGIGMVTL
jgi:drug/metabolite transporter (DMT)-like permease